MPGAEDGGGASEAGSDASLTAGSSLPEDSGAETGDAADLPSVDQSASDAPAGETAEPAIPRLPPAPPLKGVVTSLDETDDALVQLEDGRAARIRKLDLADSQGKVSIHVGDTIEAVLDTEHPAVEGEPVRLRRRASPRNAALAALADSFASRTPLEGRVTSAIKGGYEVRINGLRAFCPSSQISLRRDDVAGDPVGQVFTFILSKYDPAGRSLVVSRRKLLEKQQKKAAAEAKTRLSEGARITGTVVAFQAYGAFIDLGGVQGLLHVSEMSHSRIADPKALLQVGQSVDVVILKHDPSFKKISLSMKALVADPWEGVSSRLARGQVHLGRVRFAPGLGAFVEIEPGVEGLLTGADGKHFSEMSPQPETVLVQILELDARRHRISLARAPEGSAIGDVIEPPKVEVGATVDGVVERIAAFGVFVRLAPGKTGLLHGSESRATSPAELAQEFPVGSRVSVSILEISDDGQRIRLTRWSPAERAARAAASRAERSGPDSARGERDASLSDRREPSDRGSRRDGSGRPAERGGRGRDGASAGGPGGRGRGADAGGGGRSDDPHRSERRGPRREGGDRHENPAASKGRAFASFGDILRAKLAERLPPQEAAGETPDSAE